MTKEDVEDTSGEGEQEFIVRERNSDVSKRK